MAVYRYLREIATGNISDRGYLPADYPVPEGFELVEGELPQSFTEYDDRSPSQKAVELTRTLYQANKDNFTIAERQLVNGLIADGKGYEDTQDDAAFKAYLTGVRASLSANPTLQGFVDQLLALFP